MRPHCHTKGFFAPLRLLFKSGADQKFFHEPAVGGGKIQGAEFGQGEPATLLAFVRVRVFAVRQAAAQEMQANAFAG